MQRLKKVLLAAGTFGVLLAGTLAVVCNETVQKKIFVAWLESVGVAASFERVSVGVLTRGIEFENAVLVFEDGTEVSAELFRARQGHFLGFWGSRLALSDISAKKIAAKRGAHRATISLGEIRISTEKNAQNSLVCFISGTQNAQDAWHAQLKIRFENTRALDAFSLEEILRAARELKFAGAFTDVKTKEGVALKIEQGIAGTFSVALAKNFFTGTPELLRGNFTVAGTTFSGNFDAKWDENALPRLVFVDLPKTAGEAKFQFSGDFPAGTLLAENTFDCTLGNFAQVVGTLPDLRLHGDAAIELSAEKLCVKKFACDVENLLERAGEKLAGNRVGATLLRAGTPEPVEFVRAENGAWLVAGTPEKPLLSLDFADAPFAFFNPLLGDYSVPAGTLSGTLRLVSGTAGTILLADGAILKIKNLVLEKSGIGLLKNISAEIPLTGKSDASGIEIRTENLRVFGEYGAPLSTISGRARREAAGTILDTALEIKIEKNALRQRLFADYFDKLSEKEIALHAQLSANFFEETIALEKFDFHIFTAKTPSKTLFLAGIQDAILQRADLLAGLEGKKMYVHADDFPLDLFNAFVGENLYFAGTLTGTLGIVGEENRLRIATDSQGALEIKNFSLHDALGNARLENLSLSAANNSVLIERRADGKSCTQIDLKNARLRGENGVSLADGDLNLVFVSSDLRSLSGRVRGSLAEIFRQPMFAKINNLTTGTFELNGSLNGFSQESNFTLDLENLRSRSLPLTEVRAVTLNFLRADDTTTLSPAGTLSIALNAKNLSRIQTEFSQLEFSEKEIGALKFKGKARAPLLDLEDCAAFAALFVAPENALPSVPESAKNVPAVPIADAEDFSKNADSQQDAKPDSQNTAQPQGENHRTPDEKPAKFPFANAPWSDFLGTLDFAVQKLIVPENIFQNITGTLAISENLAKISLVAPEILGGNCNADLSVFRDKTRNKWTFAGELQGRGVELGDAVPALRTPASGEKKAFNGRFDFAAKAESSAGTLDALQENFSIKTAFVAKNGYFRAFSLGNEKARFASDLAKIGGDLAGMIGGLARNVAPQAGKIASAASALQKYFSDIPYERIEIRANHKFGGGIVLEKIDLRSDEVRVETAGTIFPRAGVEFFEWEADLKTQISARKNIGEIFQLVRLADKNRQKDGYCVGPQFHFVGTLDSVPEKFMESLLRAGSFKIENFR